MKIKRHFFLFVSLFFMAFFSFYNLGKNSLWFDEVHSHFISHDFSILLKEISNNEPSMWSYYGTLNVWMKIFGESEFSLRGLSAFFGLLTLPFFYGLCRLLYKEEVAKYSCLLLSVHPFFITYSREARSYSMVVFLVVAASYYFIRLIKNNDSKAVYIYVFCIICAIYAHIFSLLIFGVHMLFLSHEYYKRKRIKKFLMLNVVVCFFISPMIYIQFSGLKTINHWIPQVSFEQVYNLLFSFSGYRTVLLVLYLAAIFKTIWFMYTQRLVSGHEKFDFWPSLFVASWLSFPIVIAFLYSIFVGPVFVQRYLLMCLPAFVILAGVGLSSLNKKIAYITMTVFVLLSSYRAFEVVNSPKDDWRGVYNYLAENMKDDDGLIFFAYFNKKCFDYYNARNGKFENELSVPWIASSNYSENGGSSQPKPSLDLLKKISSSYNDVWVVLNHHNINKSRMESTKIILFTLSNDYKNIKKKDFPGIELYLFSNRVRQSDFKDKVEMQ